MVDNTAGFVVGQQVTIVPTAHAFQRGGDGYMSRGWTNGNQGVADAIKNGVVGTVTRVFRHTLTVRFPDAGWDNAGSTGSFINDEVVPAGADYVPPRKLGEKPEGDHIDIDDPRIQWIWDDAGAYATKRNYCNVYDQIADELGIPGRVRDFTVSRKLGSLTVSGKFKARSKKEAEALLEADLANAPA